MHTIQTILRAFPEGVIIRSLDQTSKSVISKFSNNVYDDQIRKEEQEVIILRKDEDEEQNITLEDFLCMQEDDVIKHSNEESHIAEQLVQIKKRIRHFESENTTFDELTDFSSFNVKTIKVTWEKNCHSYMHVFVETTNVIKLEKIKAINK